MLSDMRTIVLRSFAWLAVAAAAMAAPRNIAIEWARDRPKAEVTVTGTAIEARKEIAGRPRLEFSVNEEGPRYGAGAALVTVAPAGGQAFTFFVRDVRRECPIWLPAYGVVVTEAADARSYAEIAETIRARGLQSKLQQISSAPEASWTKAAAEARNVKVQTWLGLSRDIRLFAVGERLEWIQPRLHGRQMKVPEDGSQMVSYSFLAGRGWGPSDGITRRLEDGVLPILRGELRDDEITYSYTAFVSLESTPLKASTVRGTHFLVADGYGGGHMFTKEQQAQFDALEAGETDRAEETVLYLRVRAVNTAGVPRYAFFKPPCIERSKKGLWGFDSSTGFGTLAAGRVYAISKLNGEPAHSREMAILLQPGEAATLEAYIPHRPIPVERAERLRAQNFAVRHADCRAYWMAKLGAAAKVRVPEARIDEMIRAGLLHLDVITYGLEPEGTLTPTIGVYSPIGSESSPIIQFMDSMGWHDTARRSLAYFLDKQHEDGFIQNFGGYMLETGAALWSMGEHYRYTRDEAWVRSIAPKLIKACAYMQRWRARNLREDLRGKGYGMQEGKTADPEDPFRSFMLNGYSYLGFQRVGEMLRNVDAAESARWTKEAEAMKRDIRTALFEAMGRSPVVPLADGTWSPTVPPWVEYRGPLSLYADGGDWFTHGAMVSRDSLLGPLYLVFQEVVDPREPAAEVLLNFHNDLMTTRNAAFSQPYYSRHPVTHLRRGETKPFLASYYNTVAALADRETYSFQEHYFGASPHKTHEEAWFLMDTRWMLYMERGDTLELLGGVPRQWLSNGRRIELDRVASYFGPLSLRVESKTDQDRMVAEIECASQRHPTTVEIRLPHPAGARAVWVEGGTYDARTERVRIVNFTGKARMELGFAER
jgi:hypothetical protein